MDVPRYLVIPEVAALQYAVLDERRQKIRAQIEMLQAQAAGLDQLLRGVAQAQANLLASHGIGADVDIGSIVVSEGTRFGVGTVLDPKGEPIVRPPAPDLGPAIRQTPPKSRKSLQRKG